MLNKRVEIIHYFWLWGLLILLSAFWLLKPLNEYLIGDASMFPLLTYNSLGYIKTSLIDLSSGRDIWHPFLYQSISIITAKLLGPDLLWQRFIGIICIIACIYLVWKITGIITSDPAERHLILFLTYGIFILIPYGLIGGVHTDIDNTVLPPILLLFIYTFCKFHTSINTLKIKYFIWVCLALMLGFLAKLTSPLLLPPAVAIFYSIKGKHLDGLRYSIAIFAIAGTLFFITWSLFCLFFNFPVMSVFSRIMGIFVSKGAQNVSIDFLNFSQEMALIVLWFNPLIILCWMGISSKILFDILKGKHMDDTLFFTLIFTGLLFFGYLLVSRIIFSVPKYLYPAAMLIALILAVRCYPLFVSLKLKSPFLILGSIIALTVFYFFVGDPIYMLTYELKMQAMNGLGFQSTIKKLAIIFLCYSIPVIIVFILFLKQKNEKAWCVLIICIVAQTSGFHFRQAAADYRIGYSYGYRGEAEVYRQLPVQGSILYPEGVLIPPKGLVKGSNFINFKKYSLESWRGMIDREKPDYLVLGPALSPLAAVKNMFGNPDWENFMDKKYQVSFHDDYRVYDKRKKDR
jgi:hypothetical protein